MLDDSNGELRDIYSIGIKTAISDMSDDAGNRIADSLASRLLNGIISSKISDVKVECVDILCEMLKRFGESMSPAIVGDLARLMLKQLSTAELFSAQA